MRPSQNCINLIREFEGFSPKAYLCPAGVPTIGYGSTRYENGMYVTLNDDDIDETRATQIMMATLQNYADDVERYVCITINQNEFDALVDFAYNCGSKNLLNSTLLTLLNQGDFIGASKQFARWNKANGQVLQGLVNRREAERVLFVS